MSKSRAHARVLVPTSSCWCPQEVSIRVCKTIPHHKKVSFQCRNQGLMRVWKMTASTQTSLNIFLGNGMTHNRMTHALCEHFAGGPPRFQRDRCSSWTRARPPLRRAAHKQLSLLRHAAPNKNPPSLLQHNRQGNVANALLKTNSTIS